MHTIIAERWELRPIEGTFCRMDRGVPSYEVAWGFRRTGDTSRKVRGGGVCLP
jgi:hypothetical protein